jgi:D-alanyl-lipoteichoic acid acyltransferase DltB (MBOAT superfamily)
MSLSRWLRDYLYISLGGNRKGKIRTYINLMLTMLLGGLWHGAAMRFIIWGGLHGLALVVEKFFKERIPFVQNRLTHIISVFVTFHFVCFCWIFFRAETMETVGAILSQITTAFHAEIFFDFVNGYAGVLFLMAVGFVLHFVPSRIEQKTQELVVRSPFVLKLCYLVVVIFLVLQMKSSDIQPFIYFQF